LRYTNPGGPTADCETEPQLPDFDLRRIDSWIDLNGDGLPDKSQTVDACAGPTYTKPVWNTGTRRGLEIAASGDDHTERSLKAHYYDAYERIYRRSAFDVDLSAGQGATHHPNLDAWVINQVDTYFSTTLADIDHDGLVDRVRGRDVQFNIAGLMFGIWKPNTLDEEEAEAIARRSLIRPKVESTHLSFEEKAVGMSIDLDGNGLQDYVYRRYDPIEGTVTTVVRYRTIDEAGEVPYLLRTIENGRGNITTIRYADATNSGIVTGLDNRRAGTKVVVDSITESPGARQPNVTLSYRYHDPVYVPDARGAVHFAGYRQIDTWQHDEDTGRTAIGSTVWDYQQWHRGLLRESSKSDDAGNYLIVGRHTYQEVTPGGTPELGVWLPHIDRIFHCQANQSYEDCTTGSDFNTIERSYRGYGQIGTSNYHLFALDTTWYYHTVYRESTIGAFLPAGEVENGNQKSVNHYHLVKTGTQYRLVPTRFENYGVEIVSCNHAEDCITSESLTGERELEYDPGHHAPILARVRREAGGPWITSEMQWELTSGLLLRSRSPNEVAKGPGGRWARTIYDAARLYPAQAFNEERHRSLVRNYDPAYGQVLVSEGPSYKCPGYGPDNRDASCDPQDRRYAQKKAVYDGYGRLTHSYSTDDHPTLDDQYLLSLDTYVTYRSDQRSLTVYHYPHAGADPRWTTRNTDGLGRPVLIIDRGPETGDTHTRFRYDGLGRMVERRVADPRAAVGEISTVRHATEYDVFSRVVRSRFPAADGSPGTTAIEIDYDGRVTYLRQLSELDYDPSTEPRPADDDPRSHRKVERNRHGQVISVTEWADTGITDTFCDTCLPDGRVTRYEYDPLTNHLLRTITPDGLTTELDHDWLGRRTQVVQRGGSPAQDIRHEFVHDGNGNVVTYIAPHTAAQPASQFTSSFHYDRLNRLTRAIPARPTASGTTTLDPALLRLGDTVHRYDEDTAAIGARVSTQSGVGTLRYRHDGNGAVTRIEQELTIAPFDEVLTIDNEYQGNLLTRTLLADGANGERSAIEYGYDGAYNLDTVDHVLDQNGVSGPVTHLTKLYRNPAGVVTRQHRGYLSEAASDAAFPSGVPSASVPVIITYQRDQLGRVVDQHVAAFDGAAVTDVMHQEVSYYATGDPKSMSQSFADGTSGSFEYFYDDRHMLTRVDGSVVAPGQPLTSYAAFNHYTDGGRLLDAEVDLGGLVPYRDDTLGAKLPASSYHYDPLRPQQLAALVDPSGRPAVTYDYDHAGKMLERHRVDTSGATLAKHAYAWDGSNALRITTNQNGESEISYYLGSDRALIIERDAAKTITGARRRFGATEIRYDANGDRIETVATLAGSRIVDRTDIRFEVTDNYGNLAATFDGLGGMAMGRLYDPWGQVLTNTGAMNDFDMGYQSERYSGLAGLYEIGARHFEPVSRTFNQPDPLLSMVPELGASGFLADMNLYTFSANNPLSNFDPTGLQTEARTVESGSSILVPNPGGGTCPYGDGPCESFYNEVIFVNSTLESAIQGSAGWVFILSGGERLYYGDAAYWSHPRLTSSVDVYLGWSKVIGDCGQGFQRCADDVGMVRGAGTMALGQLSPLALTAGGIAGAEIIATVGVMGITKEGVAEAATMVCDGATGGTCTTVSTVLSSRKMLQNVSEYTAKAIGRSADDVAAAAGSTTMTWTKGFPGIEIGRDGKDWVKRVDPEASRFKQWWGKQTIEAQHRGLTRLGDMATPHSMTNGVLRTRHVGETFEGGRLSLQMFDPIVLKAYVKGSFRMRTPFNDIIPRNMSRKGVIFDPALDWFSLSVATGTAAGSTAGSYYLADYLRSDEE
ncbi:MAG: RHS repeat-associated core domain-containing protein, partial [Acidobacteriota bacterium]